MSLRIIWNNIIDEPTDVIVTSAHRKPRVGIGLDKAIHEAAGSKLLAARRELGTIEPGVVKYTPSFGLAKSKCKAKYVIHALGPFCESGKMDGTERPLLFGCYLQILCTAVSLKARTVSVPVMSSGMFGMPAPLAIDTAVEAIQLFLKVVPSLQVKLVGIDRDFYEYAAEKYPKLTESHFDLKSESSYRKGHSRFRREEQECGEEFASPEESLYFGTLHHRRDTSGKSFKKLFQALWQAVRERDRRKRQEHSRKRRSEDIEGEYLLRQVDLSIRSGVSLRKIKRYLSTASHATPARDTIVLLSLAMEVQFNYLLALFQKCKYPVERSDMKPRDWLIQELYRKRKSRLEIDDELRQRGYPVLKQD